MPVVRRAARRRSVPGLPLTTLLAVAAGMACAQEAPGPALQPSRSLAAPPVGDAARRLPIVLRAQELQARPDLEMQAEGDVEFRRGGLLIRSDKLSYDSPEDLARASGHVRIRRDGALYTGPELQLRVQRFEGWFLKPEFEFLRLGAGGRADRVDFIDSARSTATNALYTSCPRDGSGDPAWVLKADRVMIDLDANEGVAEGAVLRFLGLPILAWPSLSFPLTDARKSGWLPPSFDLDTRSGLTLGVPYYWNIAPQYDATITPRVVTRRGFGVDTEFRYLEPRYDGRLDLDLLPNDRVADRSRHALSWRHHAMLAYDTRLQAELERVSDDGWWRDFRNTRGWLAPRLLPSNVSAERDFYALGGQGLMYARAQHWQVLQGSDSLVTPPFQRSPQVGARLGARAEGGLEWALQSEVNRFTLSGAEGTAARPTGSRWHALASVSRPWREPGWWFVPQLSVNAASYRTDQALADGRRSVSRLIPTFSIDSGLELERDTVAFGRALRQTLEPRLHYVNTPYRKQIGLPNFDAAGKDFNFTSIYADNAYSGIDRVSDSHLMTAGITSRLLDASTGIEALRLGMVQRYLFRTQRITPNDDGTADGATLEQKFSDLLLLGSTSVVPSWAFETALQYSPDVARTKRAIVTARYAPGEFRTISTTYRLARGSSEQMEVGWQWPLRLASPGPAAASATAASRAPAACNSTWYTVGRVNYSMQDRRITDSVIGFEVDSGCWIGRLVAERLSTGRSQATTRLLFQIELVGLSRLGSNPLKVLKDNIPGYRLLRDEGRPVRDPSPIYD